MVSWLELEYDIFKQLEQTRFLERIQQGFKTMEEFIYVANSMSNRRKSRAGKSLEHHLEAIFDGNGLTYASQMRTEDKKKPDFIFPSADAYFDKAFDTSKLIFLGAKTTCKDRWRQILNEADRIPEKHLFTLQQGISKEQLNEMKSEHVTLVVPKKYIATYPKDHWNQIITLETFIAYAQEKSR